MGGGGARGMRYQPVLVCSGAREGRWGDSAAQQVVRVTALGEFSQHRVQRLDGLGANSASVVHQENSSRACVVDQVPGDLGGAWTPPVLGVDVPEHDLLPEFGGEDVGLGVHGPVGRSQAGGWIDKAARRLFNGVVGVLHLRYERGTIHPVE